MCGLAGFVGAGDRGDLAAMVAALVHRGPDAEGSWVDADRGVYLGHRRLAILDLGGGAQPMWNEDGRICVVFNGEIYNHASLRRELEARGHRFRSHHSDTEVLVHGYEEWGIDLPGRLNGMFAFAVYDRDTARIFMARDRFGEKPLYYALANDAFVFASELTSLARHPSVDDEMDPVSLQKLFAYGYIPAPNAILRGVRKLPGGHHLTFDARAHRAETRAYWRFRTAPDRALERVPERELVDELRDLLDQAVGRRLVSDVPLGIFLSGGLDSSAVALAAARVLPAEKIRTFTIGFDEPSFDESAYARRVAGAIGTDHGERVLGLDDAAGLIPEVLGRLDEPLGGRVAAANLPAEPLHPGACHGGAVRRRGRRAARRLRSVQGARPGESLRAGSCPRALHRGMRRLVDLLPASERNMSLDFKLKRGLMGMSYPAAMRLPVWMAPVEPDRMGALFEAPLDAEALYAEAIDVWESAESPDPVDRGLDFFTNLYLQDDILTKVDRASMMVSLESRAVFLDNDLVDFCRRLPARFKFRDGSGKYLLKKMLEADLPRDIVHRPKKGFGIPLARWLRSVPAEVPMRAVAGMRADGMQRLWHEHRSGGAIIASRCGAGSASRRPSRGVGPRGSPRRWPDVSAAPESVAGQPADGGRPEALLRCPDTGQALHRDGDALVCADGSRRYPVSAEGIPQFALERLSDDARIQQQHYDAVADAYVTNLEYPHTIEYMAYLDRALLDAIGDRDLGAVAEICCGRGEAFQLLGERVRIGVGVDISVEMLRAARREHDTRTHCLAQGDATRLPLADAAFDSVFMLGGIHHVNDRPALFAEIARILKPGGRFYFREPVSDFLLWRGIRAVVYRLSPALDHGTERPLLHAETVRSSSGRGSRASTGAPTASSASACL